MDLGQSNLVLTFLMSFDYLLQTILRLAWLVSIMWVILRLNILSSFFWDYSGIGIRFVHSAPDSRVNRIEGIRFTRNRQNTRSFAKFFAANSTRPLSGLSRVDIVVLRSPPP